MNLLAVDQKPSGSVRVCTDTRDLNAAKERSQYPMKTTDEVASCLQGANTLSILDTKKQLLAVEVRRRFLAFIHL